MGRNLLLYCKILIFDLTLPGKIKLNQGVTYRVEAKAWKGGLKKVDRVKDVWEEDKALEPKNICFPFSSLFFSLA